MVIASMSVSVQVHVYLADPASTITLSSLEGLLAMTKRET